MSLRSVRHQVLIEYLLCAIAVLGLLLGTLPSSVLNVDYNTLNGRKCVGGSQTVTKLGLRFFFFSLFPSVCERLYLRAFSILSCAYRIVC